MWSLLPFSFRATWIPSSICRNYSQGKAMPGKHCIIFSFQSSPSVFFLSTKKMKSISKCGPFPGFSMSWEALIWPQIPPHTLQRAVTALVVAFCLCFSGWETMLDQKVFSGCVYWRILWKKYWCFFKCLSAHTPAHGNDNALLRATARLQVAAQVPSFHDYIW